MTAPDGERPLGDRMAEVVREYAHRVQSGEDPSVLGNVEVTATEVAITVTALLQAVEIEVFELALWASWGKAA